MGLGNFFNSINIEGYLTSFWRNYYHLVWGTKNRLPLIRSEFEERLFNYIVSKSKELDVLVFAINGTEDHIHAVVAVPPKQSVTSVVKHLKGSSTHYLNYVIDPGGTFQWQRGYGCLTLGEKQRPIAEAYVRNQKQHHAVTTNSWLEYYAAEDQGVNHMGSEVGERKMRESAAAYDVFGELPF